MHLEKDKFNVLKKPFIGRTIAKVINGKKEIEVWNPKR